MRFISPVINHFCSVPDDTTWINGMKIIDKYTIDFIDDDPRTPEKEIYIPFLT
ncbi:MAG: hypothetical protein K9W42_12375 [Candidatus Heimdallarchaeota archaeon]|nr:hypothetical protein [Candidatus Heimdallarchaeota archaeon]